jgi:hypothetical protein
MDDCINDARNIIGVVAILSTQTYISTYYHYNIETA